MTGSPHFLFDVIACAGAAILFWGACAGIGYRILPEPRFPDPDPDEDEVPAAPVPASWRQVGVAAGVGLGALLALGGIGVLFRIPWWLIVVPFLVVGLALAVRELGRAGIARMGTRAIVLGGLGVGAVFLIAIAEAPLGFRFRMNVCDDWRAYLPMARRLLATNGLEEPWSTRRLQSLGGFDLLRALPIAVFGNGGVAVADTVIAAVFLGGLFVANGVRTTWAKLVSIGLILAVPFLWVPRVNTTGVLIGTPLLVVVLAATVELRAALRADDRAAAIRWAVAGGLVAAALTSVRPNLGLLGAIFLALGPLSIFGTRVLERVQVIVAGAVTVVVAMAPWSIAMWRTAGSPLYPLFPGNRNADALSRREPTGLLDLAEHTFDLVRAGSTLWVAVGVCVLAWAGRRILPDAALVALGAVAAVGVAVVFAANTPFLPWSTFNRYISPMSGGVAVFALCEMLRGADAAAPRERARAWGWMVPAVGIGAAAIVAGITFTTIGYRTPRWNDGALPLLHAAQQPAWPLGQEISTPQLRVSFDRAFNGIDPATTIVAVDRPYLIDYGRYDVENLDAPGYMTPDGAGFPFFSGPMPKIPRLRAAGYDTLIATEPESDLCLAPSRLMEAQKNRPTETRVYQRFLDWGGDIQAIAQQAPGAVRRYGPLLVIDLPEAQRLLAAEKSS